MKLAAKYAYTAVVVEGGFGIGLAERGLPGYEPMPKFGVFQTYEAAMGRANTLNREIFNNEPEEVVEVVLSSMRRRP